MSEYVYEVRMGGGRRMIYDSLNDAIGSISGIVPYTLRIVEPESMSVSIKCVRKDTLTKNKKGNKDNGQNEN